MRIFVVPRQLTVRLAVVAALVAASFLYVGIMGADTAVFGTPDNDLPIYNVATQEKKVALTFDAAWGANTTDAIIDILQGEDIYCTFFLVGFWIDRYQAEVCALAGAGHEIANHSNTHAHMKGMSPKDIEEEVRLCNDKITALTGEPVDLFRPPYGEYDTTVVRTCRAMGVHVVQWDVDSLDWMGLSASEMTRRILDRVKPGSIILMHMNGEHTIEALPGIIRGIKEKGFEFVTISELIAKENYWIDHAGTQHVNEP